MGVPPEAPAVTFAQVSLLVAILAEVVATTALKASEGFTRPWPALLVVVGYGVSFYSLSLTMRSIPLGLVYAIWSGLGLLLITLAGWLLWGQRLDPPALVGMGLIVAGVIVINLSGQAH
ncbi:multidrug efflux SMR transporter [Synechococcus sp. CBW1004]|nr:multidrug efflux SMR transporter [Synechococcus sp. CBW1004]